MANEKDKIDAQEIKKELEGIDLKKIDEPIILENIIGIIDSLSNSGEVSNKLLAIRLQNDLKQNQAYIALLNNEENDKKKKEDNMFVLKTHDTANREKVTEREHKKERENLRSARQHGLIMSNVGASFVAIDFLRDFEDFFESPFLDNKSFDELVGTFGKQISKFYEKDFFDWFDSLNNNFNFFRDELEQLKNSLDDAKKFLKEGGFGLNAKNGVFAYSPSLLKNKKVSSIGMDVLIETRLKINEFIANKYNENSNKSISLQNKVDAFATSSVQENIALTNIVVNSKIQNKEEAVFWYVQQMDARGEKITKEEAVDFIYNKLDEKNYPIVLKNLEDFKNNNYIKQSENNIEQSKRKLNNEENIKSFKESIESQLTETNLLKNKTEELLQDLKESKNPSIINELIYDCYMEGGGYKIIAGFSDSKFEDFLKTIPEEYHKNFRNFRKDAIKSVELTSHAEQISAKQTNEENKEIEVGEKNKEKMKEFNNKDPNGKEKMVQENVENENKKIEEEKLKNQQNIDNTIESGKKNQISKI